MQYILAAFCFLLTLYLIYVLRQIYFIVIKKHVPYTSSAIKEIALPIAQIIQAYVPRPQTNTWYELGAGNAKVTRLIASKLGFDHCIAIEYDSILIIVGRLLAKRNMSINVIWKQADIFECNFTPNSVLYCYLSPEYITHLYTQRKLDNQLVISLDYPITKLNATQVYQLSGKHRALFVYDLRK